jgi:uncharacterized integral membrane protein (TIGR00698 family)
MPGEKAETAGGSRILRGLTGVARAGELPGLAAGAALAAVVMLVSLPLADWLGAALLRAQGIDPAGRASPLSAVLVAIVVGMLLRNLLPLPAALRPGIAFATAKLLRLGIVCVGIKLSLVDVLRLGAWGVPVVAAAIAAGLVFVTWVNRALGLPPRLGTLIAAGTGICGVTAIVSTAPGIEAEEREVAYAVANITLFGLVAMFAYPYLAARIFDSPAQVGLFLGTSIHETAQVVGAALTYREVFDSPAAFEVATVTKLTRNLFLVAVVPLLVFLHHAGARGPGSGERRRVTLGKLLPVFVLGFVAMAMLRSAGDATAATSHALGLFAPETWRAVVSAIGDTWGARYLLGTAMAAVGLNTSFAVLRGVGLKPFAVGLAGALVVGAAGFVLALLVGSRFAL